MNTRKRIGVASLAVLLSLLSATAQEPEEWREHEPRPVSDAEVHQFLKRHMPHRSEELKQLERENQEVYRHEMMMLSDQVRRYGELRQEAPDIADAFLKSHRIEHECHKLVERVHQTRDKAQRAKMLATLKTKLGEVFDLRLKEPELHIRNLEREIAEMKRLIEKRKASKEKIVARHLGEMVGQQDDLGWW